MTINKWVCSTCGLVLRSNGLDWFAVDSHVRKEHKKEFGEYVEVHNRLGELENQERNLRASWGTWTWRDKNK